MFQRVEGSLDKLMPRKIKGAMYSCRRLEGGTTVNSGVDCPEVMMMTMMTK
jgi:hypothetical protein